VTFHGIALNLTTRLADFELINPCGMPGLRSTSVAAELDRARQSPGSPEVDLGVARAAAVFAQALARHLRVRLVGDVPPEADATAERDELAMLAAGRDGLAGSSPAVAAGAR
jgi:lipoate-protein ligase B